MAADVSCIVRALGRCGKEEETGGGKPATLVTRDLLGGVLKQGQQELDLDMHVPSGWEKRLDLKSGKIYVEPRADAESITSSPLQSNLCDLNLPPHTTNISDETLDLKLVSSTIPAQSVFQSVCTLEKVKSALERAERESSSLTGKKRRASSSDESPAISTETDVVAGPAPAKMFAAACPGCLLYVLISSGNPKCPRCNAIVPSPAVGSPVSSSSPTKRPKFDLNVTVSYDDAGKV